MAFYQQMTYNNQINEISKRSQLFFIRFNKNNYTTTNSYKNNNNNKINNLSLLTDISNIVKVIPRQFTITTKNGSGLFNTDFLTETSTTISNFVKEIHHELKYDLDIEDPRNVLGKFERLYQGEVVVFEKEDIPTCFEITEKLFIVCCPNYLKPMSLNCSERGPSSRTSMESGVEINGLDIFIKKLEFQTFTIITKNNKYRCNIFAVYLSDVIREQLEKDPTNKKYFYDFDDDEGEFQPFFELFNFKIIEINKSNMDLYKEIAEDLQIQCILNDINNYINDSGKVTQTLDYQQTILDSIDELFEWLYNIKEKSVKTVCDLLLESKWIASEESCQELVAFIVEVVKTDIILHPYLVDLIIDLNEKSNEINELKILIPFLVKTLFHLVISPTDKNYNSSSNFYGYKSSYDDDNNDQGGNLYIYSFIYKLYRKGIIQKDEIMKFLENNNHKTYFKTIWFLPLLVETGKIKVENYPYKQLCYGEIIMPFLPDKLDLYEKMLDSGEPTDTITKALRNDDVDTLQSILSKSGKNIKNAYIPINPFDCFLINKKVNYLDYAAAYGSLKCFKYLMLNHLTIDFDTFDFAIYGGNNEIIKIVDQNKPSDSNIKLSGKCSWNKKPKNVINNAILKHRNDLFDWILENASLNDYQKTFSIMASYSAIHGNAHSIAEIIFRGYGSSNDIGSIIGKAAQNGFYTLTQFLIKIYDEKQKENVKNNYWPFLNAIYFGNLAIFKLFYDKLNQSDIEGSLCYSIENNYIKIIDFILNSLNNDKFQLSQSSIAKILSHSFKFEDDKLFMYLLEKFKQKFSLINASFYIPLLTRACSVDNFSCINTITNIILNINPDEDFSKVFSISASIGSKKQCQYFIDKKVTIKYDKLIYDTSNFGKLDKQIFSVILKNINPKNKQYFLYCIKGAIEQENIELIEYLFEENAEYDDALIKAVETGNPKIVDIVLNYAKKPYLINKSQKNGTALIRAVMNDKLEIVKKLLAIPGIDPSLCTEEFNFDNNIVGYPLSIAISKLNLDIINAILDFYGDDIQYQKQQLIDSLKIDFSLYCRMNNRFNQIIMLVVNRILDIKYIDPNYYFGKTYHIDSCNSDEQDFMQRLKMIEQNHRYKFISDEDIDESEDDDNSEDESFCIYKRLYNDDEYEIENYNRRMNNNDDYGYSTYDPDKNDCSCNDTFLLAACIMNDINTVKKLLSLDCINVNQYSLQDGSTPLIIAVKNNNIKIVKLLIEFPKTNINHRDFNSQTAFKIAVQKNLIGIVEIFINNEKFDPKESCFEQALNNSKWKIKKLLISSKFFNINDFNISILHKAIKNCDIEIVKSIINHISSNDLKSNNSLINELLFSIYIYDFDIFKLLLNIFNNDVNICDSHKESLLIHAARCLNEEVIDYILNDEKFDSEKSNILTAFVESYSSEEVVHIREMQYSREMENLSREEEEQELEERTNWTERYKQHRNAAKRLLEQIIDQHKQLDDTNQKMQELMNEIQRYQRKTDNDLATENLEKINSIQEELDNYRNEELLIERNLSEKHQQLDNLFSIIDQLLDERDRNLNIRVFGNHYQNNNIHNKKKKIPNTSILTIMNKLYDYDQSHKHLIDFTQLLPNGESFFTSFSENYEGIEKVSSFLLEHGVDPNAPNIKNIYPLQIAILIGSYQLADSLINTKKIDYSVKIYCNNYIVNNSWGQNSYVDNNKTWNTYLHLAARLNNSITNLFLSKNLIDINATNELGNTPLMETCAVNTCPNYRLFFKYDNLDYLHRNNEGNNALDLIIIRKKMSKSSIDESQCKNIDQIKDREEFLEKIKELTSVKPATSTWRNRW